MSEEKFILVFLIVLFLIYLIYELHEYFGATEPC